MKETVTDVSLEAGGQTLGHISTLGRLCLQDGPSAGRLCVLGAGGYLAAFLDRRNAWCLGENMLV